MAKKKDTTNLTELLLECMSEPDPMLSMLEWLCRELMEAEVSVKLGAEKSVHSTERTGSRSGYRLRRLDTRMGTMYLMVPRKAIDDVRFCHQIHTLDPCGHLLYVSARKDSGTGMLCHR